MSVIIRLQNLAWSATAVDIRHFFRGLSIPEGGVHIVGGEFGDAFIAFSTDEDARQAMSMNGSPLKGSPVKLLLSSRNEMQKVIDQAKQQSIAMQNIPQPNLAPRLSPGGQPRGPYSMGGGGPNPGFGNAPMGGNYGPGSGPMFHPNMPGNMPSIRGPQQGLLHPPGPGMAGQHGQQGPGNYYPGMDNPSPQDHVGAGGMMRRDGRGAGAGRDRDRDDKDRHRDHRRGGRDGGPSRHRSRSRSRERERPRHRSPSPDRRSGRGGRPSQEGRPKEGPGPMIDHGGMGSRIQLPDGLRLSDNVLENLGRGGLLPLPAGSGNNGSFGPGGGDGGGFDEGQFHGGRDGEERMFSRNSGPDVDEFELMRRQRRGEDFPEPDTSVQIRMLHNDISYKDVREFFRGILIPNSGIKMINNIDGFRFGIAYVKFTREQDKQRALLKNGERHRGHVVNVYHVPDFVFDHAINSFMPSQSVDMPMFRDSCVAVRDVTPDMQPQDIAHALRFLAVDDIVIDRTVSKDQGRQWGIAYVRLTSRHDANALIRECRKGLCIFDQTLPIAFVPLDEMEKAKQANLNMEMMSSGQEMPPRPRDGPPMASPQRSPAEMRREGGPWMGPPTDVLSSFVLMKGLLPVVGERDVYDFFSDVGVVPLKVQVLMDHNRLPVGDAICEFANMDDAHRALSKNGNFMGGKAVHVRTLSIEEASDILGITLPNPGPPRRQSFNGFGEEEGPRMDGGGGGPPPHARDQFFGPNNGAPRPQRGPPGGGGGGGDLPPVDGFGRPGCVLAITNVPYKAGIKEILQFFDGFDITKECVLRRYNETGQPTGDARIAFSAPEQAERAFHVLENATIWGRTIKMMLL